MLDGMPQRLYSAAPSRLTTYLDCPRRYRFGYLERPTPPKGPPWGHNSVGSSVHSALARWWALPRARRTPEAGGTLLVNGWLTDGFRDHRQRVMARERAREQVERYLAHVDPDDEPIGIERTVAVRTPRAALWGRVDRIDDRGDGETGEGVVVVDYKTGRSVLTVDDARTSVALAVYAAGTARTLRRRCTRVELHHLPTGEVLAWDHTDGSLQRHLHRADSVAAELGRLDEQFRAGMAAKEADEAFPANVGARCGWCDFRSVCAPGQVVPAQQPWAGVVDAG
jgi:RecB family exonuclease